MNIIKRFLFGPDKVYRKPTAPPKDAVDALQRRKAKIRDETQRKINRKRMDRGADPIVFE